jgi:hypothetical protein
MATLLKKSTGNATTPCVQLPIVLHSRHQWLRWRGMLTAGIIGLAATLIALWLAPGSWHVRPHVLWLGELWIGGLVVTAIAVVIAARAAPSSLLVTARKLDGRFAGKGRLEAAALLKDSTSPLAMAQREETVLYLARETQARAVRALPWLKAGLIALILAHLLTLILWLGPSLIPSAKPALATAPPPGHAPDSSPKDSITWQTPEPATEANPAEEVPATATIESPTGLKNLTMDIRVNGQVVKSVPIPPESTDTPGSHEIRVSLHLDELKVKPFDVVSYSLHGQTVSTEEEHDVTSPVQFVQVRPFRQAGTPQGTPDDALSGTPQSKAYELLSKLELAELHSISDNFALAHDDRAPTDPARLQEDARVGREQAALSAQTAEIAKALNDEHLPASTLDPLHQAEPLMDDSGKKILAAQNSAAADSQQKALSLIGEAEKASYQAPAPAAAANNNPNDSFDDAQKHVLTQRQQTLLGQLETLANNQTHLAQEMMKDSGDSSDTAPSAPPPTTLSSPPANAGAPTPAPAAPAPAAATPAVDPFGPDADKGSFAERQEHVLKGIDTLQGAAKISPGTGSDDLASAEKQAADSLHQLGAEQESAAQEPTATAALDLQGTLKALDQAGQAQTRQALAETQQKLNDLASQLRELAQNHPADAAPHLMDIARQVHDVEHGLEGAADHQQDAGSAQGADQLNRLASDMQEKKVAPNLAAMSKGGLDPGRVSAQADALENLAGQAASDLTPAKPSVQDYAGLAGALERSEANLAHLADKEGESPTDAPTAAPSATDAPSGSTAAPSPASGSQSGQKSDPTPAGAATAGDHPGEKPAPPQPADPQTTAAFHEALQDLKNEAQQTAHVVPNADAAAVQDMIIRYDKDTSYRPVTGVDVVRFHADLQKPLEKLIVDVQALQQHAQRTEIVKTPDLDETPPLYRPAVSHYFEDLSRDYNSNPAPDQPKP